MRAVVENKALASPGRDSAEPGPVPTLFFQHDQQSRLGAGLAAKRSVETGYQSKCFYNFKIAEIHRHFSTGGKAAIHRLRKNRFPDKWFIGSELRVSNEAGKIVLDFNPS
jgi:hypothetical protein